MRIHLKKRALIKISGKDSAQFLQSQFSNDIEELDCKNIQISAYCQHQGKVIGIFWIMRLDNEFLLSFPYDLLEKIITRLKMFVIMSQVFIDDVTEIYRQIGLINETNEVEYRINSNLECSYSNSSS